MFTDKGIKIPPWLLSHQITTLIVIFILVLGLYLVYLFRRSRKTEEEGQRKFPFRLRVLVIMFYIMTALVIKSLLVEYFWGAPSQVQLESAQKIATDNGVKYQAWQISHPYAVPLLILIFLINMYAIFLPKSSRKTNEGVKGSRSPSIFFILFCLANAVAIGALIISFFHGH